MAEKITLRIDFDRGDGQGWRMRAEGECEATTEQVAAELVRYSIQYPHRAYVNGKLVAECKARGRRATLVK